MMARLDILILLLLITLISTVASAEWSLEDAKLSISSIDGSARASESFTSTEPPSIPSPFDIGIDEVIKVVFSIQSTGGEKLKADDLPHQVVVSLIDVNDASRSASSIVSVKPSSGKGSWNQRIDRLPSSLKGSSELQVTLLIASFGDTQMIKLPLVHLRLPAALSTGILQTARDRQESSQGFQRHIERRHTFNVPAADQMPPKIVSLAAAAITLILPSAVLAVLVSTAVRRGRNYPLMLASASKLSQILPSLAIRSPSSATAPFLASLFSLEAVALFYWIGNGFTLFKMMPWMLALGTVTFFVGRTALGELRRVRIGKEM